MFKKIKRFLEENVVNRYDEMEERYLAFENRIYKTLDDRLDRLEKRIDSLSNVMRGETHSDEEEDTTQKNKGKNLDLSQLKGLGPAMITKLSELDILNLSDLANLSDGDIDSIEEHIKGFKLRCERYQWIEQARKILEL